MIFQPIGVLEWLELMVEVKSLLSGHGKRLLKIVREMYQVGVQFFIIQVNDNIQLIKQIMFCTCEHE